MPTYTFLGSNSNNDITFWDGSVGIGVSQPTYKLQVSGTLGVSQTATFAGGISINGDFITDLTGTGLSNAGGTLSLSNTGVTSGTYGNATLIPAITVDAQGRITSVTNTAISYDNFGSWYLDAGGNVAQVPSGQTVTFNAGTGIGITHSSRNITINNAGVTSVLGTSNQISASSSTGAVTLSLPQNIHTGATVQFTGLTVGGDTITEFMGNGLTVSSNTLQLRLASGSGLEFSSGSVSMLRSCNSSEILSWNGSSWGCSSVSGLGGTTGTGTQNYLTKWTGASSQSNSQLYDNGTNVGVGTTNPGYLVDVNGTLGVSNTATFSGGIRINSQTFNNLLGTGLSNAGGTLSLNNTGVTSGTYGSSTIIPVLTIDAQGRITNVTNQSITYDNYQYWVISDGTTTTNMTTGKTGVFSAGVGVGISNNGNGTLTFTNTGVTYITGTSNQISVSSNTGAVTLSLPQNIHTGATVQFTGLTIGGNTLTQFMGNGLTIASNTLSIKLATTGTGLTGSYSGLQSDSSGLRLLSGCSTNDTLKWNGSQWICSAATAASFDGTGVANYIVRFADADTLTTGRLYDNGTNVGIGTTAPSALLNILGTTEQLRLNYDGTNYMSFTIGSDGKLTLSESGTQVASFSETGNTFDVPTTFSSAGNVSIANDLVFTSDSETLIQSYGPLTMEAGESFENNDLTLRTYGSGNVVMDLSGTGAVQLKGTDTTMLFDTTTSTDTDYWMGIQDDGAGDDDDKFMIGKGLVSGSAPYITLDASGNVGIGTTSPTYKLDVNGSVGIGTTAVIGGGISLNGSYISSFTGVGLSVSSGSLINTGVTFLTGTSNQISVSAGTGAVTLSLPQSINTAATVQFGSIGIGGSVPTGGYSLYTLSNAWLRGGSTATGLHVNTAGNVGIGMTNQTRKLDVTGTFGVTSTATFSGGIQINSQVFTNLLGGGLSNSSGTLVNSGVTFVTGTSNQISVSGNTGAVTLSLPQNIHTGATVQFAALGIGGTNPAGFGLYSISPSWLRGGSTATGLYVNSAGNIGVGMTNQTRTLDVTGTFGVTSTATFSGGISIGGTYISSLWGNGLTVSSGTLSIRLATAGTGLTGSFSGLQADGSGLRLLSGCTTNDTLKWNGSQWICAAQGTGSIDGSGIANYITRFVDADTLTTGRLYDNGTNVGIGTTAPSALFNILGTTEQLRLNYDGSNYMSFAIGSDGKLTMSESGTQVASFSETGNTFDVPTSFTSAGDVSISNDLVFTNQIANYIQSYGPLTLESGENFENNNLTMRTFGTGNAVFDLTGTGKVQLTGTDTSLLFDTTTSTDTDYWMGVQDDAAGDDDDKFMIGKGLLSGTTPYLTLDSSGNFGVGTTSPAQKLQVAGDIRVGTGTTGCVEDADGTLLTGTCSSDATLKTDIHSIGSVLDKFVQLDAVTYKWNDTAASLYKKGTAATQIGLIAQNVESAFPELVSVNDQGFKQVNFTAFPFYTIQAIKELKLDTDGEVASIKSQLAEVKSHTPEMTRISDIEADISGMEGRMASMEAALAELMGSTDVNKVASMAGAIEDLKIRADKTDEKVSSLSARLAFLEDAILSGSGSAVLGESTGSATLGENATVSSLNVTGNASVYDLGVSGDISSGYMTIKGYDDSLSRPGASINTIGGPLSIQPLALESVEIMGGKVKIDTVGNVEVQGTVKAEKVEAKEVSTEKLNIVEEATTGESTPSATISTKSIGEDIVKAGESEIVIKTKAITTKSRIYVTFNDEYYPATRYWITDKIAGTSFTLKLDAELDEDARFSWFIVN